jgi:FkbM family methyltransferase
MLTGLGLTRIPPIRWAAKWVLNYASGGLEQGVFSVHGLRMVLPVEYTQLGVLGFSERFVTEFFMKNVRAGMTAVDVGANVGYYTLLLAKLVGKSGKVFAVEPDPANAALLRENVRLNGLANVEIIQKAAWSTSGFVSLHLSPDNPGGHWTGLSTRSGDTTLVEAIRLDEYLGELVPSVDVMKLDTEGTEYLILTGMQTLLRRSPAVKVVAEYNRHHMARAGVPPDALPDFMTGLGFEIAEIGRRLRPLTGAVLRSLDSNSTDRGRMLLFARRGV